MSSSSVWFKLELAVDDFVSSIIELSASGDAKSHVEPEKWDNQWWSSVEGPIPSSLFGSKTSSPNFSYVGHFSYSMHDIGASFLWRLLDTRGFLFCEPSTRTQNQTTGALWARQNDKLENRDKTPMGLVGRDTRENTRMQGIGRKDITVHTFYSRTRRI